MKKRSGLLFFIIPVSAALIFLYAASYKSTSAVYASPPPGIMLSSDFFNPIQEQLVIFLPKVDMQQAISWIVEILEPHPSYMVFQRWVGRGDPPEHVFWDGRNFWGEWVHSASEYPLVFYVCDTNGNIRTIESRILVDAFIISEGGKELIQKKNNI